MKVRFSKVSVETAEEFPIVPSDDLVEQNQKRYMTGYKHLHRFFSHLNTEMKKYWIISVFFL